MAIFDLATKDNPKISYGVTATVKVKPGEVDFTCL